MRKRLKILFVLFAVILFSSVGFGVYVADCYPAAPVAIEAAGQAEPGEGILVFHADEPVAGLIFYPGGKVAYESYAPLMSELSQRGILCVLIHMPCNLAVLDVDAAKDIPEQFPEIRHWYIGGHSLGGAMAASYAAKHPDDFDGIVLLAAYSTADLTQSGLQIVQIYGTEDGVMNRASYEKYASNLPEGSMEIILEGGNHAGFGAYGPQKKGWRSGYFIGIPMGSDCRCHFCNVFSELRGIKGHSVRKLNST